MDDAVSAARVLLAAARPRWRILMFRMIREGQQAHAHVLKHARPHPIWGDGTLSSAALKRPHLDEPFLQNLDYIDALILVLDALKTIIPART
jgi:hypothetical protein